MPTRSRGRLGCPLFFGLVACAGAPQPSPAAFAVSGPEPVRATPVDPGEALYVAPDAFDFSRNPALLVRVKGSAHGYFRFVNAAFSSAVCTHFAQAAARMPVVNLHGDAHLEQYAVTATGRGLADYEDSTSGPAVIDLSRFGVSLHLACEQRGWHQHAPSAVDAFLRGYREALANPMLEVPEPSVVARMRAGFRRTRDEFLAWAESLMEPAADRQEQLEADILSYARQVLASRPNLPTGFFRVKRVGAHHLGVGSALDEKYLFRVEGPSTAPGDDMILEFKEVRAPTGAACMHQVTDFDPQRIAIGQARISYRPFRYFGYVRRGDRMFWVHEWVEQYQELSVANTLRSPAELSEVALDVGVQLGRGHPNQLDAGRHGHIRRGQLAALDLYESELRRVIRQLTLDTAEAWQRFRAAASERPSRYPE